MEQREQENIVEDEKGGKSKWKKDYINKERKHSLLLTP